MSFDLTSITKETAKSLRDRFGVLLSDDARSDELANALYDRTAEEKALVQSASAGKLPPSPRLWRTSRRDESAAK